MARLRLFLGRWSFGMRLVRAGCVAGLLSVFFVAACLFASGLVRAVPGPGGVAVLLLHEVDQEPGGNPAVISPGELAGLLDSLRAAGYALVLPADFLAYLEGKKVLPERGVVVSFDDGYAGVYLHGYPVLRERGLAAFLFPVAKWYSPHPRPERARPHPGPVRRPVVWSLRAFRVLDEGRGRGRPGPVVYSAAGVNSDADARRVALDGRRPWRYNDKRAFPRANLTRRFASGSSSVVEHRLAKAGAAGSNPVFRSKFFEAT